MAENINSDGFIDSNDIIVFPCANRGDNIANAKYSQLLTEYNLTHTNGIIGSFDSYVINNSYGFNDEVQFKAVIGGYLFIIPDGFNTTTYKYIGIIVSTGEAGHLQKITVNGSTVSGSDSVLDDGGKFYGARFLAAAPTGDSIPYSYILDVDNDTSAIARYNSANSQLILN